MGELLVDFSLLPNPPPLLHPPSWGRTAVNHSRELM